VEGIAVVTLTAGIRQLGRGHRLAVRLAIDGTPRDEVVDAITTAGVRIGDELVFWDRITHADACAVTPRGRLTDSQHRCVCSSAPPRTVTPTSAEQAPVLSARHEPTATRFRPTEQETPRPRD
jgi:hypothetical protein